jgi:alpha-L-fucosidase
VRYHPVDIRTSEHFDFIWQEQVRAPRLDPVFVDGSGQPVYLPLEYCTTITPGWFWNEYQAYSHPSAATLVDWYQRARASGGNFLLNIGPNKEGLLPETHRQYPERSCPSHQARLIFIYNHFI